MICKEKEFKIAGEDIPVYKAITMSVNPKTKEIEFKSAFLGNDIRFDEVIDAEGDIPVYKANTGEKFYYYDRGCFHVFKNREEALKFIDEGELHSLYSMVSLCIEGVIPKGAEYNEGESQYMKLSRLMQDKVNEPYDKKNFFGYAEGFVSRKIMYKKVVRGFVAHEEVKEDMIKGVLEELGFTLELGVC